MQFTPDKFGMMPFWFWNGEQNETEITRQLELAKTGGVKGMAVHARKGNRIEYMSGRWLELLRHTCREARRLGLEIWLYDEEGCPSGTVGLRLPSRGEKYQQKALKFAYVTAEQARQDTELIRAFAANNLTYPADTAKLPDNTPVLTFSRFVITDFIDALDRATLEEFLNMTHRIYWRELREFFGGPVTGIYTDDLNHMLIYGEDIPFLPYTDSLEETFREKCGYGILDKLSYLVENMPGCEKIRLDFRHTVMRMFLDNYVEPMRQWCERHGLPLTGHLSGDEGTMLQSISRFGAAMPFYEHEDIPGIDDFLTGRPDGDYLRSPFNKLGFSMIVLCKQAASVAGQLKNGICSSEVLTSLGWGVPMHQQMAQLRFQQGLGINLIVPHDFSYSTAGVTKRDHPASYFFQQPWFTAAAELHKSIARSSQLLSRGRCAAKVAVLYPITSGWAVTDGNQLSKDFTGHCPAKHPELALLEQDFAKLSLELLQQHIDFEYIDEELLARHGSVGDGKLTVGHQAYETLIFPTMVNINSATLALVRKFAETGGKVVQYGNCATLVDGLETNNIFDFPTVPFETGFEVRPLLGFTTEDNTPEEILLHSRLVDGHLEYYIGNFSSMPKCIMITSCMSGYVLYDPDTNRIITENKHFPTKFMLQPKKCCHLLPEYVPEAELQELTDTEFAPLRFVPCQTISEIHVERENKNILLIDAAVTDDGKQILFSDSQAVPAGTTLHAVVEIPDPQTVNHLLAEAPGNLDITVNGKKPEWLQDAHHPATCDLHAASLRGMLHSGKNHIRFVTTGKRLEPVYLTGAFSVKLIDSPEGCQAQITNLPLTVGNAAEQGLPFYWGCLKYSFQASLPDMPPHDVKLDLGHVEGVVRLSVNGQDAGMCYGAPWTFRLNGLLRSGNNNFELKLYNTAQNFFGPHRAKNIFGPRRAWEGSSDTAWTPELSGSHDDSWGVASFGLYGPVQLLSTLSQK